LKKSDLVGAISEIVLKVADAPAAGEAPAPTATPAPAAAPAAAPSAPPADLSGDLIVFGAVETPLGLAEADLRGMQVVKITAEHPKSGAAEYEGVRLSELLALARPAGDASKVVFIAVDGYSVEAGLPDVAGCADCMVAFTNTPGKLKLAMPGQSSSLWVKDVSQIELR
jgi:hypothetical protein